MVPLWVDGAMISLSKLIVFVISIVLLGAMISISYAVETIQIFENETFEVAVSDASMTAGYDLNFSFSISPYRDATLFLNYTNEIDNTIIDRCKVKEVSVFVDSQVVLSQKYSEVQAFALEQAIVVTPDINHTGRLFIYGIGESKLMGTICLHIEYTISNGDGGFNFNPLDFGSNWMSYCVLIIVVAISITALLVRRRRRSGDEV